MTRPTNPVVAQVDREAAAKAKGYASFDDARYWGNLAGLDDIRTLAEAFARHRQSADAALVEALEKCVTQFTFMAKLASGSRVYEIEKATGKRVRRPLGEVISSECEVAATYVRAAIAKATGQ